MKRVATLGTVLLALTVQPAAVPPLADPIHSFRPLSTFLVPDRTSAEIVAATPDGRTLIYTDVARDGMLEGPDVTGALALQETGAAVIVSGGVSSLADLQQIERAGLAGAVVGRALYEGRFELSQALRAAGSPSPAP